MVSRAIPASLVPTSEIVSVRGRRATVPAWRMGEVSILAQGSLVRMASVLDAYWLPERLLPSPHHVIDALHSVPRPPDLFTFTQRAPDTAPMFPFRFELDNVAAVPVSTHAHWLERQISAASRRNVRTSERRGVSVRASAFDEAFVRGIMAISNETPVRAGRKYWHYGKDYRTVEAEQGTYRDRATFLGAYVGSELIGYCKIVWDERTAAIMQIVSKLASLDRRPNNALLSEAVRLCAERGVGHLLYEKYVYGRKESSSLTRFKRENGFVRLNLPQYFVPLTATGRVALQLGLHRPVRERVPEWLTARVVAAREAWYARRFSAAALSRPPV